MLTSSLRIGDCAGGHRLENRGKNRDVMVVPRKNLNFLKIFINLSFFNLK